MAGTSRMSFTMNILLIASLVIFVAFLTIPSQSLGKDVGHRRLVQNIKKMQMRNTRDKARKETPKKTPNSVLTLSTKISWSRVEGSEELMHKTVLQV